MGETCLWNLTQVQLFPSCLRAKVQPCSVNLRTYTGEVITVVGELSVVVQHGQLEAKKLSLIIAEGDGPPLLGRNWLEHVQLDWKVIKALSLPSEPKKNLETLLRKYEEVFQDELGHIRNFNAKLIVRPDAEPKFIKARSVPFAMKSAVEEDLDRLERIGVIEKILTSDWAAPIVAVPKKDGCVRLCGDYKVTINPALSVDQYPPPVPEALFATLLGGKSVTTLDLSQAYQQLELDEASKSYLAINTNRGLYQYTRLPYGVASAPAQFQKIMDTILQGIPGVLCYIDDIFITGSSDSEHLQNLEEVLKRLKQHRVRVKKQKRKYIAASVEYLGHRIN